MELKSEIWVQALVRTANAAGAFATVARRGDRDGGAVLVRCLQSDGAVRLLAPARNAEGERVWLDLSSGPMGAEAEKVEAYVQKRITADPDLWVIDIEDNGGRHFLTEPIEPVSGA